MATHVARCPAGHPLDSFETPEAGYECDRCEGVLTVNSAMAGCRVCNWDVCSPCLQNLPSNLSHTLMDGVIAPHQSASSFPSLGVSLVLLRSLLDELVARCGPDATTRDLCSQLVAERTKDARLSYVEWLQCKDEKCNDVGPATHFVSHVWSYRFRDVVDALEASKAFADPDARASAFLWFDCVSVNQHFGKVDTFDYSWWATTFVAAIKEMNHTLFVFTPWDAPKPLTRSWCLWELAATLMTSTKFEICLPEAQRAAFEAQLITHSAAAVSEALSAIDVANAEAFSPHDQRMIVEAVTNTIGIHAVNLRIKNAMRGWLEGACVELIEGREAVLEDGNEDALNLLEHVAVLFEMHGRFDKASELYSRALGVNARVFGDASRRASVSRINMAVGLKKMGKLREAGELFLKALECVRTLENEESLLSMVLLNVGVVKRELGSATDSLPYYEESLALAVQVHGQFAAETLNVKSNLARLRIEISGDDMAGKERGLAELEEVAQHRSEVLGPRHPGTLNTLMALGQLLYFDKRYQRSLSNLRRASECFAEVFGHDSYEATTATVLLGEVLIAAINARADVDGRAVDAESLRAELTTLVERFAAHALSIEVIDHPTAVQQRVFCMKAFFAGGLRRRALNAADEAIALARERAENGESANYPSDDNYGTALYNIAKWMAEQAGEHEEAVARLQILLQIVGPGQRAFVQEAIARSESEIGGDRPLPESHRE